MSDNSPTFDEIDALLRDNVADLVTHLTGKLPNNYLSRKAEARFGSKGGIAVTTSGRDKGRITLFDGDGKGRSPIQFIQEELDLGLPEAVSWAKNWLGLDQDYRPDPRAEEHRRRKRKKEQEEAEAYEKRQRQKKNQPRRTDY